jgi:hypothetical protein
MLILEQPKGSAMSQLRSLAPWIAYPLASGLLGWRGGAAVALAVGLVGLALDGRAATSDAFRTAAVVFFGALTVVALADPTSPIHHYVPALIPATLAVAASASIVAGRPFTVTFAKRVAPPEFWDTPLFVHINVVLTAVWAVSFAATAAAIATALVFAPQAAGMLVLAQIAGFVVPMRISRGYPARARARYLSV